MTTLVEKFQADTIGLARTEQIRAVQEHHGRRGATPRSGRRSSPEVGVEQRLQVGKIKTVDVGEEYTTHTGQRAAHSSNKLFQISSAEKFEGSSKSGRSGPTTRCCCRHRRLSCRDQQDQRAHPRTEGADRGNAIDFKSGAPAKGTMPARNGQNPQRRS